MKSYLLVRIPAGQCARRAILIAVPVLLLLGLLLIGWMCPNQAVQAASPACTDGSSPNCQVGRLFSDPDCVTTDENHIFCVAIGYDDAVWIKKWDHSVISDYFKAWFDFTSIGGVATSAPSITALNNNSIEVVVRGLNNGLWHNHFNGTTWSGFLSVPDTAGHISSGPDCTVFDGDILCTVIWDDTHTYIYNYHNNTWNTFATLIGQPGVGVIGGPTIASWSDERIDLVVRGGDNAYWQFSLDGGSLSGWVSLGGIFTSDPECISYTTNYLECFGRGLNGHIWYKYWDGAQWNGWSDLGGSFLTGGGVGATYIFNSRDIFAVDAATKTLRERKTALSGWYSWQSLRDRTGCTFMPAIKK
jgi:hypothetical protein